MIFSLIAFGLCSSNATNNLTSKKQKVCSLCYRHAEIKRRKRRKRCELFYGGERDKPTVKWRDLMNIKETKFEVEKGGIFQMGDPRISLYPFELRLLRYCYLFCLLFCLLIDCWFTCFASCFVLVVSFPPKTTVDPPDCYFAVMEGSSSSLSPSPSPHPSHPYNSQEAGKNGTKKMKKMEKMKMKPSLSSWKNKGSRKRKRPASLDPIGHLYRSPRNRTAQSSRHKRNQVQ